MKVATMPMIFESQKIGVWPFNSEKGPRIGGAMFCQDGLFDSFAQGP
jgi:hypothetical protein